LDIGVHISHQAHFFSTDPTAAQEEERKRKKKKKKNQLMKGRFSHDVKGRGLLLIGRRQVQYSFVHRGLLPILCCGH